jgi:hypothetical protein
MEDIGASSSELLVATDVPLHQPVCEDMCVKIGLYRVEGVCQRTKTSEHSEPRRPCAKEIHSWRRMPD